MAAVDSAASPPSRGRPRDPRRDEAILDAALTLVAEVGYDRMTVDALAARAGVSKPTIYRRWPDGKVELMADAIRLRQQAREPSLDTGSLRGDLIALVVDLTEHVLENAHVAAGLTSQLRGDPEFARLFHEHVVAPERERWSQLVERAVARGELDRHEAVTSLFSALAPSVIHSRVLLTGEPVDAAFAAELVDRVLLPVLAASGASVSRDER